MDGLESDPVIELALEALVVIREIGLGLRYEHTETVGRHTNCGDAMRREKVIAVNGR